MSIINNGGPAFPRTSRANSMGLVVDHAQDGMTLRDYFAAKALQRFIGTELEGGMLYNQVADVAYMYADAMLKAREK